MSGEYSPVFYLPTVDPETREQTNRPRTFRLNPADRAAFDAYEAQRLLVASFLRPEAVTYADLIAARDARDANQRMLDLWNLGAIARLTRLEAAVDRRYHLSDELNVTLELLYALEWRRRDGDEKAEAQILELSDRCDWLRARLAH